MSYIQYKHITNITKGIEPTFETIQYGERVQYHTQDGYHSGVKVHFFNQKGVLIGNYYKWVSYSELGFPSERGWVRVYYNRPLENVKQFGYEILCRIITFAIRTTQKISK